MTEPPRRGAKGRVSLSGPPAGLALRWGPMLAGLLVVLLLGSSAGMIWLVQHPADDAAAATGGLPVGGPFTLTDGTGRVVTEQTYRGKYLLVYFGYTTCPDVCPTTLSDVAAALDKLGTRADRLQPLFITVDPARDTPDAMQHYTSAFSSRLVGLTGTAAQIKAVAREYRVYYAEHRTGAGPNDYSMDHSSILYLMGPDGAFIAPIRADAGGDVIAADLAKRLPS